MIGGGQFCSLEGRVVNYGEAKSYLERIAKFGSKPGLERISCLLDKLGNPQENLRVVHVGGTNGKGSTSAFISSLLAESGYRVALFTSPHLQRYEERFRLNGKPIPTEVMVELLSEVKEASGKVEGQLGEHPTFFEIATALNYLYAFRRKADFLVQEVGLGGRFDATNVVEKPLASVITNVAKDHTQVLGSQLRKIAREKAGIIKNQCPTVTGEEEPVVWEEIRSIAEKRDSRLFRILPAETDDRSFLEEETRSRGEELPKEALFTTVRTDEGGGVFHYRGLRTMRNVEISLLGDHQISNAALATYTVELLMNSGAVDRVSERLMRRALKRTRWPGRLEQISSARPPVFIDGAHNPAAMRCITPFIERIYSERQRVVVFGVMGDKDWQTMLNLLVPMSDQIVFTSPPSPRAADPEELAHFVGEETRQASCYVERNPKKAMEKAEGLVEEQGLIFVLGSLYLAGAVKDIYRPWPS